MAGNPNHPTAPVIEGANAPGFGEETCDQIKARFGIETGTHDENTSGETKKNSSEDQSHHILQNAAIQDFIERGAAIAVMLKNSHSDTEHGDTTRRQNERRDNKKLGRGGTQPASNFGELKKLSREDLVASLKGRRNNMSNDDAKKLADCLVAEAEKAAKESAETQGKELNDNTPVQQTGGCFAKETIIWLNKVMRVAVHDLQPGQVIDTSLGYLPITRMDWCRNDLVELHLENYKVTITPFHRVRLAWGGYLRADEIRPGYLVDTDLGPMPITAVQWNNCKQVVYNIGFSQRVDCRIGEFGLWVEVPDSGVPVSHSEKLTLSPLSFITS
jgi:hypothetical protein